MATTAIIGLGAMGQGMARNIINAGVALKGYDISPAARAAFAEAGGVTGEDPNVLVAGCNTLVVVVANAAQVEAALFSGVTDALAPGSVVILCATVAPSDVRAFAERLEAAGHMLLDAPISGGQVGANAGALTVMASGPADAFARADPVLQAISKKVHKLGDAPGLGATYKVVHQLAAGVHLVAAAEVLSFGVKAGCDADVLFDILVNAAGQSWMLEDRGPRMMTPGSDPTSTVDIFVKDLGLVAGAASEVGARVPLAEAALGMIMDASRMGLGREDDSRVIDAYQKDDSA